MVADQIRFLRQQENSVAADWGPSRVRPPQPERPWNIVSWFFRLEGGSSAVPFIRQQMDREMAKKTLLLLVLTIPVLAPSVFPSPQEKGDKARREEGADQFKKWLDQDVVYIISDEERAVFQKLSTPVEKEQFIEQFWKRRDPNPRTPENEYREEHYRRIAYANDHFTAGIPGWLTDRGRIYIIQGPPDEIESHPTGGFYDRPREQGGGSTTAYPFEKWWYRHIEGVGAVAMEFVDRDGSGDYALAVSADEKDALANLFGPGLNERADLGLPSQSSAFADAGTDPYLRDNPFSRYRLYAQVQAPPPVKYTDLKQLVDVTISYSPLSLRLQPEYFKLDDHQVLTPVTVQIENRNLTFAAQGDRMVATLAIYGVVTSISNEIVTEFEDEVTSSFPPAQLQRGLTMRSTYQKMLFLEGKGRYKLDLVVKDLASGGVGVLRQVLVPPTFPSEALSSSSLVLSNYIQQMDGPPRQSQMFVLGDVRVRPSVDRSFPQNGRMGVYFQLYGLGFDQATREPSLRIRYQVLSDEKVVSDVVEESNESLQFRSPERVVLIHAVNLDGLPLGGYQLRIEVVDRIGKGRLDLRENFEIAPYPAG